MAVSRQPVPPRAGRRPQADVASQTIIYSRNTTDDVVIKRPRQSPKALTIILSAMVVTIGVVVFWAHTVVPWWSSVQTQWQYGSSRITQLDANVGHGGECHFLAEYYNGAIIVIEIPYANTNASHVYTIPGITGDGVTPVVLLTTTKDSQTGRRDLVVSVAGTSFETVLYNTGSAFSQEQH